MAEWSTRTTQNRMGAIPCGFESHLAHKMSKLKLPDKNFVWTPKLAGVTLHALTKIETEATPNPSIETLKKIAKGLNVSVDDLIN